MNAHHAMDARLARDWLRDALSMVLPVSCVSCGRPNRRVCDSCREALEPRPFRVDVASTTAPGLAWEFPVVAGTEYAGEIIPILHALKEENRTGIARDVAHLLRASVNELVRVVARDSLGALFVAPPTSRANYLARGFEPVELLARRAKIPISRELRGVRARDDQSGLGVSGRDDNMRGSMAARRPLRGASVILIDDLMTTGATLREMARAVREAGGDVIGAATLAYTRRRFSASQREIRHLPEPDVSAGEALPQSLLKMRDTARRQD